jgi:hypothetical protein
MEGTASLDILAEHCLNRPTPQQRHGHCRIGKLSRPGAKSRRARFLRECNLDDNVSGYIAGFLGKSGVPRHGQIADALQATRFGIAAIRAFVSPILC